jgi:hypothetical protein
MCPAKQFNYKNEAQTLVAAIPIAYRRLVLCVIGVPGGACGVAKDWLVNFYSARVLRREATRLCKPNMGGFIHLTRQI